MNPNALIPRQTIEDIVKHRDHALELFASAWTAIEIASKAIKAAHAMALQAAPRETLFTDSHVEEVREFYAAVNLPDQEKYARVARRIVDITVWSHLIKTTDLQKLMDKQAKDEMRDQMRYIPDRVDRDTRQIITDEELSKGLPPVTVDNVYSTLQHFMAERDTIFARGIANAFSKLDRRFLSHDGFKVGSRIILTRVFNSEYGGWSYHGNHRDTLIDIERAFTLLDGKTGDFTTAISVIDQNRRGYHAHQSECETEYFSIRIFKNGNAHLWFVRDDLVQKVNQVLAAFYGEVLGSSVVEEEDPLFTAKLTPAKKFGFYPTQAEGVAQVEKLLPLHRQRGQEPLRVLEPSAGTGNLARMAGAVQDGYDAGQKFTHRALVDCVEIQGHLANALRSSGDFNRVYCQDFMQLLPQITGLYDRVVMNPPFDRERDIDHVMHAMKFLRPDGYLVAIMSASTEHRGTRKSSAFRRFMREKNAVFYDMPSGSFSALGTNVNTLILAVWNDGRKQSWTYGGHTFEN